MKRILLTLSLSLVMIGTMAQDNKRPRFNPEEFKARLESYITQKAELSSTEAEKFFPIYHEMKAKQREVMKKVQDLKRKHPAQDTSEKKYTEIIYKIAELDEDVAEIEEEYYKKLCKAISPQKVYRAILADDSFHREMVQRFNGHHKEKERR